MSITHPHDSSRRHKNAPGDDPDRSSCGITLEELATELERFGPIYVDTPPPLETPKP